MTVPSQLLESTIQIVAIAAIGSSLTEVASTSVITLTEGVLKAMLLSKLRSAFLGLVAVALVTTGAGVIAQDRPSDDDRLKILERKMDRLLEVLGGSNRRTPSTNPAPDSGPEPAAAAPAPTPALSMPPAAPAIATMPQPPHPPMPPSPPAAALLPGSHAATAAAIPSQPPMPPSGMAPTSPPSHSNSLARRVDSLEERLAKLEQQLADLERRLRGAKSGLPPTSAIRDASGVHISRLETPDEKQINTDQIPPAASARPRDGNAVADALSPPLDTAAPSDTPARTEFTAGRR